jgi:hypothetical protein
MHGLVSGNVQDTPSGILNITAISSGAHVFMSKPHFLDCEDSIPNAFGPGMGRGVREKHDTFIDVDPVTGAVRHQPAPNFNFNFKFNYTSTFSVNYSALTPRRRFLVAGDGRAPAAADQLRSRPSELPVLRLQNPVHLVCAV